MFEVPTQLIDYRCELEAIDERRNVARAYRIDAAGDLFGHVIVALRWGRIGRRPARLTVSFSSEEAASRFIQRTLARRASAPLRIGVGYSRVDQGALPSSESAAAHDLK